MSTQMCNKRMEKYLKLSQLDLPVRAQLGPKPASPWILQTVVPLFSL